MMKKITRLALLAVAAAFLVAALPACSSGSGGEGDTAQSGTGGGGGTGGSGGGGAGGSGGSGAGGTKTYVLDATVAAVPADYEKETDISLVADGLTFTFNSSKEGTTGETYNHKNRYNMGGRMTSGNNYIGFTTTGAGSVVVHFYNNGSSAGGRHAVFITDKPEDATKPDTRAIVGAEATVASSNDDITTTFTFDAAGKYYVGGDAGIYITKLEVTF